MKVDCCILSLILLFWTKFDFKAKLRCTSLPCNGFENLTTGGQKLGSDTMLLTPSRTLQYHLRYLTWVVVNFKQYPQQGCPFVAPYCNIPQTTVVITLPKQTILVFTLQLAANILSRHPMSAYVGQAMLFMVF